MKKSNTIKRTTRGLGDLLCCITILLTPAMLANHATAAEPETLAIQKYFSGGVTLATASDAELKSATESMLEADPANAAVNVSESVRQLGKDSKRIDTLLTSTVAQLREGFGGGTADFKSIKDFKTPPGLDCELVREIWTISIQNSPTMEQLILEVGVREAPECFAGFVTEGYSETGTTIRTFSTDVGLFGGRNIANSTTTTTTNNEGSSSGHGTPPVNSPED